VGGKSSRDGQAEAGSIAKHLKMKQGGLRNEKGIRRDRNHAVGGGADGPAVPRKTRGVFTS